ncbi:intercompartmental signaling factor BofC [Metabacillus litoralis]|uniref:intercompartmental signaling factor BofC n=1 Tax=Metabacillus litoralis TaxID=152268 RepID=UPI00299EE2C3|nr:intercompartmental signaling factor BofC [Metabacillus litoralis]
MSKFHRGRIITVCCFLVFILSIVLTNGNHQYIKAEEHSEIDPLMVEVILQRKYLDGEVSEEITKETILSMEDFWATYESWQLVDQNEERIIFEKKIDDISPLLKTNGYFGLAGDGTLSIFNGKPETNEVIQSFFQIDMDKLESHKHDELIQGIRIQTKDQYLEVIKMYETYSKAEKK